MLAAQKAEDGPLLISASSDVHGSIVNDTIVQKNCTLHVRGNLLGSLTIESGAKVVVEGSVDGKIINKGGRLIVNNKGLAAYVAVEGPAEGEACGILKFNLSALAANWEAMARSSEAECAAVIRGNAYGCGIEPVAGALAKSGCKTFFVSNIPEARRVRALAPNATIYVLNGFYSGTGPSFAEINARPVINSAIEMAEWDVFVTERRWSGGCALNVDTGESRLGLSPEEAAVFAQRLTGLDHGISLLMSRLDHADRPDHPLNARQLSLFRDLRRLYEGVPASLATSPAIFLDPKTHFELVRTGEALYGVNPTPGKPNPMQPVIDLRARIVQVRDLAPGETIADTACLPAKRRSRVALISVGHADGYPRCSGSADYKPLVIIGGRRCPVLGRPALDLTAVDVSDLPDPALVRCGETATLIGRQADSEIVIDDLAAAVKSTGREILTGLGQRFHRIYYAI